MQSDCLDFRKLPGQNPVFLAYLSQFDRVQSLFHAPPSDALSARQRAQEVLASYRFPRSQLVPHLSNLNQRLGGGEATGRNLKLLAREDTVAVVTGQQVGLFGGPAYTLYKAATACRLAAWLCENDVPAVPIFWMAADDSDFEEVRSAHFINRDSQLVSLRHPDTRPHPETMAGAAKLQLDEQLETASRALAGFAYGQDVAQMLSASYQPGSTFADAFGRLLSTVFRAYGLILFDSRDPGLRAQTGNFFAQAVQRREEIVSRLLQRSQDLRTWGFQPQVAVDDTETLLFYLRGDERYKLRFEHGRFQSKDRKSLRFSPEELETEARERPENFGFNALLRPILQDWIFPAALYVGGPAEVAYFAQVNAVASIWNVEPVIVPRASLSVLDRKSQRLLEKYQLSCEEVLTLGDDRIAEKILHQGEQEQVLKLFGQWEASTGEHVASLQKHMREMDPPLVDMLSNARAKIEYQIRKVRQRFITNQKSQAHHLQAHLSHLINRLRPGGVPQERHFTFTQFLAEEGPQWLDRLMSEITHDCPAHRIWRA